MTITLRRIPQAFHLPRPDWGAIRTWVEANVPAERQPEAWAAIADDWLRVLADALEDGYRIDRSRRLLLLSSLGEAEAGTLLRIAESGLTGIVEALGDLACEQWVGPLVILLFADDAAYKRYASSWDSDEQPISSAGMCVRGGYVHIALAACPMDALQLILLHELTHACLSHVHLPLWLEEGVTQLAAEAAQPQWSGFSLGAEEAAEIRTYWKTAGLSDFWWGAGFFRHDEGQTCSYRLADILFRLIATDHRRQLADFVRHAHVDDAGESAARKYLGRGIGDLAQQFLGAGHWDPAPLDAAGYTRRGILAASRDEHDVAIRDFNRAVELNGRMAETYTRRGWSFYKSGRFAEAIDDCEQAIKLDPADYFAHNTLGWIFATSPNDAIRDAERALKHASIACERSGHVVWSCLDTLAAACAEIGDFEEAVRWGTESLGMAPDEERAGCEERLQLYRDGRSCRE